MVERTALRRVHRQLRVVDAEPVAVGVAVGEQPGLQHLVGARPDTRDHVAGVERRLLHLGEVVAGCAVQLHAPHLDERVVAVRPHLGEVEGVDAVPGRVGLGHQLHLQCPGGEVTPLDGLVEVLVVMGRVLTGHPGGGGRVEAADPLVALEVELHPVTFAGSVHPLEGVRPIAVHVAPARRQAPIAEQPGELVRGLGRVREEIPNVVGFLLVGVGVVLLGVDEVGELQRVTDEEDRGVVAGEVPVALGGVELDGETTGVTHRVRRPLGAGDGGEANENLGLLTGHREHVHPGPASHLGVGDRERAIRPGTHGVHDPLGDALPVEPGELLDEMLIGKQYRARGPGRLGVLVVGNRSTRLGGQGEALVRHGTSPR